MPWVKISQWAIKRPTGLFSALQSPTFLVSSFRVALLSSGIDESQPLGKALRVRPVTVRRYAISTVRFQCTDLHLN